MTIKLNIIELFGGIGACTKALKRIGFNVNVLDYVEIDKYAVKSYNAINETDFEPQNITKYNKYFENVDLITHGSPCQDFSTAGLQAGGDENSGTRSSLMYESIRIIKKIRPKYVLWENVKNLLSKKHKHNFDNYINRLNELGYNSYYQVLDAEDYGVPQHRERVYTISIRKDIDKGNFKFPEKEKLKIRLKDILEDKVDEKYYLTESNIKNINRLFGTKGEILNVNDFSLIKNITFPSSINQKINPVICPALTAAMGIGGGNVPVINELDKFRKLTPKECWRLMSFSDEDFEKAKNAGLSNTQLYKQAGNSIVVNVLSKIFFNLLEREIGE